MSAALAAVMAAHRVSLSAVARRTGAFAALRFPFGALRLARGIQNKVLEAMAIGRPVVVASECAEAIAAVPGKELLVAADADAFAREIDALLREPARAAAIGKAGRKRVLLDYSWSAQLSAIDIHLGAEPAQAAKPVRALTTATP